jgi:M6 family metalloprotease-like protein
MRSLRGWLWCLGALFLTSWLVAAEPKPTQPAAPDLSEFRTVDKAVTTKISLAAPVKPPTQPGYLGIHAELNSAGKVVIAYIDPESPAAAAGLKQGDLLQKAADKALVNANSLKELLQSKAAGETIKLAVLRKEQPVEVSVKLGAPSRPLSANSQRAYMGVRTDEIKGGLKIAQIVPGSPAEKAGLKSGDEIIKVNGTEIPDTQKLTLLLEERKPGDVATVLVKRAGKDMEIKITLGAIGGRGGRGGRRGGWDLRRMVMWRKDVYRLAVVAIEYPDAKHNAKITEKDWENALFTRGTYTGKSPTGQQVYGSMNDYYLEQSCDKFHIEGKVFPYILVSKKRTEYLQGNRFALFTEALDKLLARDGKDAMKDFDGIFFLYAGERVRTQRGGLYWPHRATVNYKGKRWAYFICPEGGARMASISVASHEFGHMLGLPDLYAAPERPGSKGLGIWCTMSTGHGQDGKPLHFSAWCKEQLGWIKPAVIDPRVKQKLILAPIEKTAKECYKVLIQADGSEYLLLENRVKKNFDRDLPGQGMLIWRVVNGRPILQESHGINGPEGPFRFMGSIPYPSKSNTAYTPLTTPSSKSVKGGGWQVHITNIRKLPDGRITFFIGYDFL